MRERQELETLFLDNLGWIERTAASLGHRHGLDRDDVADFTSWVKLKLVEDDYAVVRKYRGESSITTYLTVVVAMLFRDYRVHRWGRWRPSAAARRHGPLAVRLETLVRRRGMPLAQAAEVLRSAGETTLSDRELAQLLGTLRARQPLRPVEVGPDALAVAPGPTRADDLVDREGEAQEWDATRQALDRAIERLPAEDRVILRLRFWEEMSVADIARGLGVPQKPLYRRIEHAVAQLREELVAAGVSRDRARSLLSTVTQ